MPRKKISKSQKVRNMLDVNVPVKEIAEKLMIPPQTVYNIRYQYNKRKGLAQLPAKPGRPRKDPIVVPQEAQRPATLEQIKDAVEALSGSVPQQPPTQKEQESGWLVWLFAIGAVAAVLFVISNQ